MNMNVNNLNQQRVQTREEYKKALQIEKGDSAVATEKQETQAAAIPNKRIRIRLIPIWLRLVLLVVFTFVSLVAGAAVGYGVIGDGKPADVLKESTWTHIRDLVNKKE
jgi:hypothetical protein